jgi:hypothetical protein
MKCQDFERLLIENQNSDLLPPEARNHLGSCPACFRLQKDMEKVWSLMDDWQGIEPSTGFQDRFWAKAKSKPANVEHPLWDWLRSDLLFHPWRPAWVGVLMILLVVGGGLLFQIHPPIGSTVSTLNLQKDDDNLLLQNLRETEEVEATEELEAFDAWIFVNEESPSGTPSEEPFPSKDSPERRTWITEQLDLA